MSLKNEHKNLSPFLIFTLEVIDRCSIDEQEILFDRLKQILDAKKTDLGFEQEIHEAEDEWQRVSVIEYKDEFLEELKERARTARSSSGLNEEQMRKKLSEILERNS